MEDTAMSSSDNKSDPSPASRCELLILHTAEAQEWATYLQTILKSSRKFPKRSIVLHAVQGPTDELYAVGDDDGYDFSSFQSSRCIVLLLTAAFLDLLQDRALWDSLERFLRPPHRVVALLCGVAECDVLTVGFDHWPSWRKLHADQEPAVYVSTILESIADSRRQSDGPAAKPRVPPATLTPSPVAEEETVSETESVGKKGPVFTCLTVQPNRVPCGDPVTIFIIFKNKLDSHSNIEVEFSSCESVSATRVPATLENEYTISVAAPDMPAGEVALTVHTDQASEVTTVSPVTYYTNIGQVNFYLQNATNPMEFLCQAFNITSNVTESLDDMLTDSLKSRMPATGLHLFGIRQIKEATYETDLELPTLLHFAARFGLKKLSTVLLQCPGALQAYSVTNKYGEYPNKLAQRSGFLDLRDFMDDFVKTVDMVKTHLKDSNPEDEEEGEVYQKMEDVLTMHSSCSEELIYECMEVLYPERADDIYMAMSGDGDNSEEAMLRQFLNLPQSLTDKKNDAEPENPEEDEEEEEEEEDPYLLNPEDIYHSVDGTNATLFQDILHRQRPPAPIPRPQSSERVPEGPYITSVFSERRSTPEIKPLEGGSFAVRLSRRSSSPVYDPYGGVKTPGQRQLIALQEKVKVGVITVEEAVQEFKAWQFDHERRSSSLRYQQEKLKRFRDSIKRRHKDKEKWGKNVEYEITSPLRKNHQFPSGGVALECGVYESGVPLRALPPPPAAAALAPPPAGASRPIQRGSWKTGSNSSTSSTESNRLSTHSTMSYSSGTEPEFEDALDSVVPPTRPPRPTSEVPPNIPPPRIPPRIPERDTCRVPVPEEEERYIACPTRALPERPPAPRSRRRPPSPPPVPRRHR